HAALDARCRHLRPPGPGPAHRRRPPTAGPALAATGPLPRGPGRPPARCGRPGAHPPLRQRRYARPHPARPGRGHHRLGQHRPAHRRLVPAPAHSPPPSAPRRDRLGHRSGHPRPVGAQRLPDRGGHTAGHPHTALGQRRPGPLLRRLHQSRRAGGAVGGRRSLPAAPGHAGRPCGAPMSAVITLAAYATCALAGVILAVYSLRNPEKIAPLRELLAVLLAGRAARVVLVVFWWWLGWHFLIGPTLEP